jgi:hypothetical protein
LGEEVAAEIEVGVLGIVAFAVYERAEGSRSPPLLEGVRVMVPATVGVMVKVCVVLELEKVRTIGERPVLPAPEGVRVIVPVYGLFGVTEKLVDVAATFPDEGPLKVYAVAVQAFVVNVASDEVPVPTEFTANAWA